VMLAAHADLFDPRPAVLPAGFKYQPDLISKETERTLAEQIAGLPLKEFEFQGFLGKRRIVSFGWRYDFNGGGLQRTEDLPTFLLPVREQAAAFAGMPPERLQQVLLTEYKPGVQIGWHKDRSVFGEVIGVSLLSSCTFRLRRKLGTKMGACLDRRGAAIGLFALRPGAHGMGAQHSGRRRTAILDHVPQFKND